MLSTGNEEKLSDKIIDLVFLPGPRSIFNIILPYNSRIIDIGLSCHLSFDL